MGFSLTFLGTGSSLGVPVIGCSCKVCTSSISKNKRLRSSALLKWKNKQFLIDCGPDFRQQMLSYHIDHVDGVFFTHGHFDHIGGFDDLRIFSHKAEKPLPCLVSDETRQELERRCHYLLEKGYNNLFSFQIVNDDFDRAQLEGLSFRYVKYLQQGMKVLGFIFGNCAYITDIKNYNDEIFKIIKDVDILVLSTVRSQNSGATFSTSHLTIEEAITFAHRAGAKHTIFTHLGHELDYEETLNVLPNGFSLAYDGMKIDIKG